MSKEFYLYADEASLAILDNAEEKVLLVGSDFGYGNFGDILQHTNTVALHHRLGRYRGVAVMAASAIGDARFPEFVRCAYGAEAVIFVSEVPFDVSPQAVPLQPVQIARNVGALHLYGGGFLNDMWGGFVLGVAEYLLRVFQPRIYVVSGQQITTPYEVPLARHLEAYRPALFGVRDSLSLKWMTQAGHTPDFSFDDATEALQALTSALPLERGPGMLMQLNVSDYTNNAADEDGLYGELTALTKHGAARGGLTVLQAYADRRVEVVDTRESIKELERTFPFADYRTLELPALAYQPPHPLAGAVSGEIGYSCSYHVALWLQLAGIPCWLRGSNLFYQQKKQALQVDQDFEAFLREPRLADHTMNLEERERWQENLGRALLSAPSSSRACVLPSGEGKQLAPWRFKGNNILQWREAAENCNAERENLLARVSALNAHVTELGAISHALRHRAEIAEAKLEEAPGRAANLQAEIARLHQEIDTFRQVDRLQDEAANLRAEIARLHQENDSLVARIEAVWNSTSWKITRPLRGVVKIFRPHLFSKPTRTARGLAYALARWAGRLFPFSIATKTKWKKRLLRYSYPAATTPELGDRGGQSQQTAWRRRHVDMLNHFENMRPQVCGLETGLVSVVLPVFNQADLIAESIDSVLAQTYANYELIIIDDGSTDGIEAVLQPYLQNPKIRLYQQANQKLPKALSNGFAHARGEFWTWTSADNIMGPLMLETLVGKLKSSPTLGMVYADYHAIDDRGGILTDPTWRSHNRPAPESGEIRLPRTTEGLNVTQDNFIGPCFMYRGWIGRCIGDYDPQLGVEDYDYWMRINAFFNIEHLGSDDLLYRYRVHDNTLSANAHEHRILEKGRRLMQYEQERAAYYHLPLKYVADDFGEAYLRAMGVVSDSIQTLTPETVFSNGPLGAAVIGTHSLVQKPETFYQSDIPLVLLIDDPNFDYLKLKGLRADRGLILADDENTTSRARLVCGCPVLDARARETLMAITAFCKSRQFLLKTRGAADLARQLPRRVLPKTDHRLLLQVESFIQGGLENVVIDLAVSLKNLGFRISIAILGREGDAANKAREQGLEVISFGRQPTRDQYVSFLKKHNVDIVNAHYSIYGAEACSALGIPFIQTIHNSYVWLEPEAIRAFRDADNSTDTYVCVSATAARYAESVLGLDLRKMRVIPNGINPESIEMAHATNNRETLRKAWGVDAETIVYLNVASIMATKAQLPLVRAFGQALKALPNARLVLLGSVMEPAYFSEVENAIRELGLGDQIILAGYDRSVAKYYHASDVFILPSYWEGWSLSLGEAVANGLPCVISDVGSAYEFGGDDSVEIVSPPFGDITKLNWENLHEYVYREDPDFEAALTQAMLRVAHKPRKNVDTSTLHRLDRQNAYRSYAALFADRAASRLSAGQMTHAGCGSQTVSAV